MRECGPVTWVPALDAFVVTSRAAVVEVLRDAETFTVDDPRFSTAQVVGPSMLSRDGSDHMRHRRPFVEPFRPRRVLDRFQTPVDAQIAALLDEIAADTATTVDLRPTLAAPLAASVVATSLGLDGDNPAVVARLVGWYGEIVASVAGVAAGRSVTPGGAAAMADLATELRAVLEFAHGTADGGCPADSVLTDSAATGELSDDEVISNAGVIMFGGIETVEGMILNVLRHVLSVPEVRDEIVADPALGAAAIEESLRLEPAAAVVDRYAARDVELGGVTIGEGSMVTVSLAGANRDPGEFHEPDRFDLHRPNVRRHLAFATGPHVCIGMDLARLEARRALTAFLGRFPTSRLGDDAPAATGPVFRKPARLPVALR